MLCYSSTVAEMSQWQLWLLRTFLHPIITALKSHTSIKFSLPLSVSVCFYLFWVQKLNRRDIGDCYMRYYFAYMKKLLYGIEIQIYDIIRLRIII